MVERLKALRRAHAILRHAQAVLIDTFQDVVSGEGRDSRRFLLVPLKLCLLGDNVWDRVEVPSYRSSKLLLMRQFMPWR